MKKSTVGYDIAITILIAILTLSIVGLVGSMFLEDYSWKDGSLAKALILGKSGKSIYSIIFGMVSTIIVFGTTIFVLWRLKNNNNKN